MRLARVVGNVVSTIKDDGYAGRKLLIVEYFDPETRKPQGARMIAFDCTDAGVGDIVMVNTDGGAGNLLLDDNYAIVDLTICGVLDSYTVNKVTVPVKSGRFIDEDTRSSIKDAKASASGIKLSVHGKHELLTHDMKSLTQDTKGLAQDKRLSSQGVKMQEKKTDVTVQDEHVPMKDIQADSHDNKDEEKPNRTRLWSAFSLKGRDFDV